MNKLAEEARKQIASEDNLVYLVRDLVGPMADALDARDQLLASIKEWATSESIDEIEYRTKQEVLEILEEKK